MDYEMNEQSEDYNVQPSRQGLKIKIMITLLLFMGIWIMFRLDAPWALKGQQVIRDAFHQENTFQSVSAWYGRSFSGSPAFLPALHPSPVQDSNKVNAPGYKSFFMPVYGKILIPYSSSHQAILLQTQGNALVSAIEAGRVVFAGVRKDTGYTIVIQHAGGYLSTYGMLQSLLWSKDDWIKLGELVGKAETPQGQTKGNIILALMKDAQYIDPTDVISFE